MKKAKLFWDSACGCCTDDDTCCPVYKGKVEDIYIETWKTTDELNSLIDFTYSQAQKDAYVVDIARDVHFQRHNIREFEIIRVVFPPSYYDKMYNYFYN